MDLPWITSACGHCGVPLAAPGRCAECQTQAPPYPIRGVFRYECPISHLITRFKFHHGLVEGRALALLFAEGVVGLAAPQAPDVLVPVPLHPARLRERGFNQAELLAEKAARRVGALLVRRGFRRLRSTMPQARLTTAGQRQRNVAGAFEGRVDLRGARVAVVDDVVTSGATATAFAHTVAACGAESVEILCCARTPLKATGPPHQSRQ